MMRMIASVAGGVLLLAGIALLVRFFAQAYKQQPPTTRPAPAGPVAYRTEAPIEPDTCVAAWLLTRVVSPKSNVVVSENYPNSIPFDVPRAQFSRQTSKSVSRQIVEYYSIKDPFALAIMKVAQELEIMPWTTNQDPLFNKVRDGLAEALNSSKSDQECMNRALQFIDQLRGQSP